MSKRNEDKAEARRTGRPHRTRLRSPGLLTVVFLLSAAGALVFELTKHALFPHVSIWQSHGLTIAFVALCSVISFYLSLRSREGQQHAREQQFRLLFANNALPMWLYDLGTLRFMEVNDAAVAHYGYSRGEFLSMSIEDIRPPEDVPLMRENLEGGREALEKSGPWRHQLKDGRVIDAHIRSHLLEWNGRRAALVVAEDVTESRQVQEELFQSRRLLQTVLDTIPQRVFWKDRESNYLGCNRAFAGDAGLKDPAEIVGKNDFDLPPKEAVESYRADDQLVMDQDSPKLDFEERMDLPGGNLLWLRTNKMPLHNRDGRVIGVLGTYEDVTGRKQAEEALRQSEERLRLVLDSTAEAIYAVNLDGNCTMANAACCRMLGYPDATSLLGKNTHALWHHHRADGSYFPAANCRLRALRDDAGAHVDDEVFWHADGTRFPVEYWSYPIHRDGTLIGHVVAFLDITERKRAEKLLRESEERYRALLSNIPGVVWTFDERGRVAFISPNIEIVSGYTCEEIYERGASLFLECIHPEDLPGVKAAFEALLSSGQPYDVECRLRRKDGEWIWVHDCAAGSYERDGVRYADGVLSEITARKRAEKELEQRTAYLDALIENSPLGIVAADPEGRIQLCNPAFRRLFQVGPDDIAGSTVDALIVPSACAQEANDYNRRTAIGQPVHGITRRQRKDGSLVDVELWGLPLSADGRIVGTYGLYQDITERRRAEAENSRLAAAVTQAGEGVFVTDSHGVIQYVNPAFTRMTGYSAAEAQGQNPRLLRSGEQDPEYYTGLWETISSGRVWQGELINRRKDGTVYTEEMTIAPVRDSSGVITNYVAVKRDVTDRKRVEEELHRSRQLLQSVLDNIPQGVFWKDRDLKYLGCNRTFAVDAGLSAPAEVAGKDDLGLGWGDLAEAYRADDRLVMGQGVAKLNFEEAQKRRDGSSVWLRASKVPLRDPLGRVIGVLGTYENITERRLAEQERAFLASLVESSTDAIIGKSLDGQIRSWNKGAESLYGYLAADVIGKPVSILAPPDRTDEVREVLERVTAGERVSGFETLRMRKDGTLVNVSLTVSPIRDASGQVTGAATVARDITDRKRAEEALRETGERFHAAFEHAPLGMCLTSLEGRFQQVNATLCEMLGYSHEELLGGKFANLTHPDDLEISREVMVRIRRGEAGFIDFEKRYIRRDGQTIWARLRISVAKDGRGQPSHCITHIEDITWRRQTEEALRESEQKYRSLISNIPDVVWTADSNLNFIFVSDSIERVTGFSIEEVLSRGVRLFTESLHPDDLGGFLGAFDAAFARHELRDLECRARRKDGEWIWVHVRATATYEKDGIRYVDGLCSDITARKHAEEARGFLASMVESSDDAIVGSGLDGTILSWNKGAELLYGHRAEEVIGRNASILAPTKRLDEPRQILERIRAGETVAGFETSRVRKDGTLIDVSLTVSPIRNASGDVVGVAAITRNIGARKRAEDALRKSEKQFRQLAENIREVFFVCTSDPIRVTYLSPAYEEIWGRLREEVYANAKAWINTVHRDDREQAAGVLSRGFQGEQADAEFRIVRPDGSIRFIRARAFPVGGVDGRFHRLVGIAEDVTERKVAEEALLFKNALLEAQSEATLEGVLAVDEAGRIVLFNRQFTRVWNVPEAMLARGDDALLLKHVADQVEDCQAFLSKVRYLYAHQDERSQEELKLSDGRTMDRYSAPLMDSKGTYRGRIWYFRDITERRRAEEARALLASIVESSNDAIVGNTTDGRIASWNRGAEALFGYRAEEVIGKPVSMLVAPEYMPKWQQDLARLTRNQRTANEDGLSVRKDGKRVQVSVSISPIVDSAGMVAGGAAIIRDVTERKRAEEALRDSEGRLRALVDSLDDAVFEFDAEGAYLNVWASDENLLALPKAQLLGRRVSDVVDAQVTQPLLEAFRRVLTTGRSEELEYSLDVPRGSQRAFLGRVNPIRSADGSFRTVCFVSRDITERKHAEEELRQAKEAAEAASRAKSEFLANMSHEIRTPMNGVIGMTELALTTDLNDEQREYLTLARTSADTLMRVINDILDFSKIEAKKLDIEHIAFDLRESIQQTMRPLAALANEKGLELLTSFEDGVPRMVLGDPGRLEQVLTNLVSNAVKFTEHGEVEVSVRRELENQKQPELRFSVRDTGIGIPPEKQRAVFEAFVQADTSSTRRFGGTGLGLAISSQLVSVMGGRIWLESAPGTGSTFQFTVPLEVAPDDVQPGRQQCSTLSLKGLPVLAVDDNATNRRILQAMLTSWEMAPTLSESGPEALALLQRAAPSGNPYPLIIVDSQMPCMDGFMLVRRIKEELNLTTAAIMMLTSGPQPGDAARCRALGVTAYLTKPISESELRQAVLQVLGSQQPLTAAPRPDQPRGSVDVPKRNETVLIVEDNPVNSLLALRLLEKLGYAATAVSGGREGIDALEKSSFDAVLMDVQMPEMDGFEATAIIRRSERESIRDIPIIAMTAHAMQGDRERCLAAGMDSYVAKPVSRSQLAEALNSVLHGPHFGGEALGQPEAFPERVAHGE